MHLTIVVHPKKEAEGQPLGMHSIYGGAKATQEADNVLIVQKREGQKFLELKKNRYDGTLGSVPLSFDTRYTLYYETPGFANP